MEAMARAVQVKKRLRKIENSYDYDTQESHYSQSNSEADLHKTKDLNIGIQLELFLNREDQ